MTAPPSEKGGLFERSIDPSGANSRTGSLRLFDSQSALPFEGLPGGEDLTLLVRTHVFRLLFC